MSAAPSLPDTRSERRARAHAATRAAILDAARRVAAREGARDLSLRAVAAEAGFAPAALYGYFRGKDELLLALAADDLATMAHAMRDAAKEAPTAIPPRRCGGAALGILSTSDTLAAVQAALPAMGDDPEAERHFNGRLIAVLTALSAATGQARRKPRGPGRRGADGRQPGWAGACSPDRGVWPHSAFHAAEILARLAARFAYCV